MLDAEFTDTADLASDDSRYNFAME